MNGPLKIMDSIGEHLVDCDGDEYRDVNEEDWQRLHAAVEEIEDDLKKILDDYWKGRYFTGVSHGDAAIINEIFEKYNGFPHPSRRRCELCPLEERDHD